MASSGSTRDMSSCDCIPQRLSQLFYAHGKAVARRPWPFLLIPLLICLALCSGALFLVPAIDVEYLYVPVNAPSLDERARIETDFETDDRVAFTPLRALKNDGFIQVIVQSKDVATDNVFTDEVMSAIAELDHTVRTASINHGDQEVTYEDVCASWHGNCHREALLDFMNTTSVTTANITFPIHNTGDGAFHVSGPLARVTLNEHDHVAYASSFMLTYYVKYQHADDVASSDAWMNAVRDILLDVRASHPLLRVELQTSLTLGQVLEESIATVMPLFIVTFAVLSAFAIGSTLMSDCTRGKPLVALAGEVAAGLGAGASIGALTYMGVPFASAVGVMPFLIVGIGLDDMYIVVSAWRYTSPAWSVEERTGRTLQSAAVSITITSLTDALAFGVGCLTPFRSVQIFCAYTGAAVLLVYVLVLTSVSAVLVFSGRREQEGRHALTWQRIPTTQDGSSTCHTLCCTGGTENTECAASQAQQASSNKVNDDNHEGGVKYICVQPFSEVCTSSEQRLKSADVATLHNIAADPTHGAVAANEAPATSAVVEANGRNGSDARESASNTDTEASGKPWHTSDIILPFLNRWLEHQYAPALMKPWTKALCALSYVVYIGFTVYGLTVLKEGLNPSNLAPDGTYFAKFYDLLRDEYGQFHGPYVMCVFNQTLDYTDSAIQNDIDSTISALRQSEYFYDDPHETVSWLEDYKQYLSMTLRDISTLSMPEFTHILRHEFLAIPAFSKYSLDVRFSGDNTSIVASRVFVRARGLMGTAQERAMMNAARTAAEESALAATVFSALFTYFDNYEVVLWTTLQNLGVAVGSMLLVAALLIPSVAVVLCVSVTTVCICAGVMGFMALWGVSLDSVSMINLIMCIGFSVDFSAHICYHFSASRAATPEERAKDTLGQLGAPIVQAALSTVMAIAVLAASPSYVFRTFFKIVLLVMLFGFYHAVLVLPILLATLLGGARRRKGSRAVEQEGGADGGGCCVCMSKASSVAHGGGGGNASESGAPNGVGHQSGPADTSSVEVEAPKDT